MNPVAFSILGLDIRWYGIIIACAMMIGIFISKFTSKMRDVDYNELLTLVLIALPLSLLGARLYYVLFNLNYYSKHLTEIFNTRQGGLAIHGGVLTGFITSYIYAFRKKINFFSFADVAAPSIILAQAIGRWGNFFNGEAHGGPVSYNFIKHFPYFIQKGMYIDGTYYHPTFLYESIWNFCSFVLLLVLLRKTNKIGLVFFTYIGLYSIGRFFIEGLRTDSLMLGPLRMAQVISLLGVLVWMFALLIYFKNSKHTNNN